MTTGTGYAVGGSSSASSGGVADTSAKAGKSGKADYWSLEKNKKAYLDYLGNKTAEIEEQKESRRYYHSAHWTEKQLKVLKARRQPPSTRNRINRKIDGTIGLIERLRQEPKAFPRTPKQEEGAELATAVLRYVLDEQQWKAISPECGRDAAIDGIGGIQIELEKGDRGDIEVGLALVEPDSFFYDPRSYKPDFSDALFMGEGKWLDVDTAVDMFPDHADAIKGGGLTGSDLTSNPDREQKWFSFDAGKRLVRIVDIWYQHKGSWCWSIFTGSSILMEGESYLQDEKKKKTCKYIMFSCNVDHDGDRYGFVRNMKSTQDSLNYKHSKLNHILASKRLFIVEGSVSDVEKTRAEYARSDGVIMLPPGSKVNESVKADDQSFDFAGWAKLLEEDKQELDNYGPNQALIGDIQNQSGRAIQLLQQAGMAELGPYILGYRGWKLRVYRAAFCAVQKYWTAERWVRVTDDEGLAQFIQLNGTGTDPKTGQPVMVNALGSLDVDIILDEGPDTVNAQADVYETLSQVLPAIANMLTPVQAQAAVKVLLETSALPASAKKQFRDASQPQQPDPLQQRAALADVAGKEAVVKEKESKAVLNMASAQKALTPDAAQPDQGDGIPPEVKTLQAIADVNETNASAVHKRAQAAHISTQAMLAPVELAHDTAHKIADRDQRAEQAKQAAKRQAVPA